MKKDESNSVYLKQIEHLSIRDIRLLESRCKIGDLRDGELPDTASHSSAAKTKLVLDKKIIVVAIEYKLSVAFEHPLDDEDPIIIEAKFGISYDYDGVDPKTILDSTVNLATITSWSYWREFVQSTMVRMGLPGFPMPIMSVNQLVKKVGRKKKSVSTSNLKKTKTALKKK